MTEQAQDGWAKARAKRAEKRALQLAHDEKIVKKAIAAGFNTKAEIVAETKLTKYRVDQMIRLIFHDPEALPLEWVVEGRVNSYRFVRRPSQYVWIQQAETREKKIERGIHDRRLGRLRKAYGLREATELVSALAASLGLSEEDVVSLGKDDWDVFVAMLDQAA